MLHLSHSYLILSDSEKIAYLKNELKFNRSQICKRAYFLIHHEGLSQSAAMQKSWKEAKQYRNSVLIELGNVTNSTNAPVSDKTFDKYMTGVIKENNKILSLD